jgi:hypothetical protein
LIIKNYSIKQIRGAGPVIRYVLKYVLDEKKQEIQQHTRPFIITHNIRNRTSLPAMIKEYTELEGRRLHRRVDQVTCHHTIISLSPEDAKVVTDEMLMKIAKEFIRLRAPHALVVGSKHENKSHPHIHLIFSGINLNGKSIRMDNRAFGNLKEKMELWQQIHLPELAHSKVRHGLSRDHRLQSLRPPPLPSRYRMKEKEATITAIQIASEQSASTEQFIGLLKDQGLVPYYRNNRMVGISVNQGRKYQLKTLGFDLEELEAKLHQTAAHNKELLAIHTLREKGKDLEKTKDPQSKTFANRLSELHITPIHESPLLLPTREEISRGRSDLANSLTS